MGSVDSNATDTRLDYYMSYIHCYSAGVDSLYETPTKTRSVPLGDERDVDDDDDESESLQENAEAACSWPEMRRAPPSPPHVRPSAPWSPPFPTAPTLLSTSAFPFPGRAAEGPRRCPATALRAPPVGTPRPPPPPPPPASAAPTPTLGQLLRSVSNSDFRNGNLVRRTGAAGAAGGGGEADGVTLRKPRSLSADYRYSRLSLPSSVLVSSREAILEEHMERRRMLQQEIYYREQARSILSLNKSGSSECCAGEHWRCRVSPALDQGASWASGSRDSAADFPHVQRSKRLLPATPTGRMPSLTGECPRGDMSPDWNHPLAAVQRTAFPFRLPPLNTQNPGAPLRDHAGAASAAARGHSWSPAQRPTALRAARSPVPSGEAPARRPRSSPSFQLDALRGLVAAGGGERPLSVFRRSPSVGGEATPQRLARSRQRETLRQGSAGSLARTAGVWKAQQQHQQQGARDSSNAVATPVNIRRTVNEMTMEEVSEAMKDLLNGNIRNVAAKIERLQRPPRPHNGSSGCDDGESPPLPPTSRYEEDLSGEMIYVATL
ncbi:uncharacterized protein LOC116951147 isoform X1 [Petromyzon marinus]|uniref:uncharacterized protein LOC116951147 isoform X1 n=2 Tax=Petromyzon marinus TaxID=7757 RepID=UPI003F710CDC